MTRCEPVTHDLLQPCHKRLTPQRELVLSAVRALGHATPEEVAEKVRQTHPGINLSTVYRNLETLENVGLVQHTHLGHGGATYHAAEELTHLHLVCDICFKAVIIGQSVYKVSGNLDWRISDRATCSTH